MAALYSDILLDHFRHPRNYGSLASPDVSNEQFNPLCGDRIRLELKLEGSKITDVRFKGDGCAISIAAASLLTELLLGTDISDALNILDAHLIAALDSNIQPARRQCALLPLNALREGLEDYKRNA